MNNQNTLQNKVIIVTGATQGIGLATSHLLSKEGAIVVLVARTEKDLNDASAKIPNSFPITADMRDIVAIKKMIQEVVSKFGRIDILINNAAQGLNASVETIDIADFRKIIDLNVVGTLAAMQEVIPVMRSRGGGQIINISSVASKEIIPYMSAYASTKYALNCISLTAREELKKDNILVSLVHPDLTDTNFGSNLIADDETKKVMAAFFAELPPTDSAEIVAKRILETIISKEAEVYVRAE
ncbi:MAG: SDR family oxidoreductase [Candidatus Pacebacteria bacterium]|nr:SDR family oxidoreductase [Candidatus Paceibacterota bacterium]